MLSEYQTLLNGWINHKSLNLQNRTIILLDFDSPVFRSLLFTSNALIFDPQSILIVTPMSVFQFNDIILTILKFWHVRFWTAFCGLSFSAENALKEFFSVGGTRACAFWWRRQTFKTLKILFYIFAIFWRACCHRRFKLRFFLFLLFLVLSLRCGVWCLRCHVGCCRCDFVVFVAFVTKKFVCLFLPEFVKPHWFIRRIVIRRFLSLQHPFGLFDVRLVKVSFSFCLRHFSSHLLRVRGTLVGQPLAQVGPLESEREEIRLVLRPLCLVKPHLR